MLATWMMLSLDSFLFILPLRIDTALRSPYKLGCSSKRFILLVRAPCDDAKVTHDAWMMLSIDSYASFLLQDWFKWKGYCIVSPCKLRHDSPGIMFQVNPNFNSCKLEPEFGNALDYSTHSFSHRCSSSLTARSIGKDLGTLNRKPGGSVCVFCARIFLRNLFPFHSLKLWCNHVT